MRLPSIKTLSLVFGDQAKEARQILKMSRAELDRLPAGEARNRECYNRPKTFDVRLHCLDAICDGSFGLESAENRVGEYLEYLNAGETYALTLIYWRGSYSVSSIGSIIENPRNRF